MPVMDVASGEHGYATAPATSSGSIRRFTEDRASSTSDNTSSVVSPCTVAWSANWFSTSGVRTYPGHTQLLVTPLAAPSSAMTFDSPSSPCLALT